MVGLGDVEDEADRVEGDDGGEQGGAGLAAGDQVAGIDLAVGDAAADRRPHVGPFEVELGRFLAGFRRLELGAGHGEVRLARVELLVGDRLGLDQRGAALDLQLGQVDLRLGAGDLGLCAFDGDLERPLVDGEQRVTGLDDLAVTEVQLVDEARDAGAYFDRGQRFETTGEFVPLRDALGDRLGDTDRRGGWSALRKGHRRSNKKEAGGCQQATMK